MLRRRALAAVSERGEVTYTVQGKMSSCSLGQRSLFLGTDKASRAFTTTPHSPSGAVNRGSPIVVARRTPQFFPCGREHAVPVGADPYDAADTKRDCFDARDFVVVDDVLR